jgi:hypothetical protein
MCCFGYFTSAQNTITGTVYNTKGVLEGAAVYFNNTMVGTTTNKDGAFKFDVKTGNYELVVSFLGFKKIVYSLNTATYTKPLIFVLEEDTALLDEIIVRKTVYDATWQHNLTVFKREFLGTSKFADNCELKNPKALHFNYNAKTNTLKAFARAPLKIINKSLGYAISFDLEDFVIANNKVVFLGYSKYTPLKGSKRKQKRWAKNRERAYYGSFSHFYKSLLANTTYKDGFLVHQFKRVPNPKRPSETALQKARAIIKNNKQKFIMLTNNTTPKTKLDSALVVLKKAKLPKTVDVLYKSNIPITAFFHFKNGRYFLAYKDHLSVVYTKELEEKAYITRSFLSKVRPPVAQTSNIIATEKPIYVDIKGNLLDPTATFYEGYWSFEKFAHYLPLDYVVK